MTQRIPLDHLTSDQYDELCGELERLRADARQCAAQQWPQRLARAETALARIQAIADDHPAGIDTALIHAALPDQPADDTTPVHVGGRANAEDCPACRGTNPPYPWICPVEKQPGPAAHNDGPSVREAAADDRRWPLQKTGE